MMLFAILLHVTLLHVFDGDTILVRDESGRLARIRLSGIDAPENAQPFGAESRESLAQLVGGCPLVVEIETSDRYGRLVARVSCADHDVSLEQVVRGLAWSDPLYSREEGLARTFHRGLWSQRDPIPPWRFRRLRSPPEIPSH